jgi:hypothetical protein
MSTGRKFFHACDATCAHQDVKVAPVVQVPCRDVVVQLPDHHGVVHACGDVDAGWDELQATAVHAAKGQPVAHMGTTDGMHLFKVLDA